MPSVCQVLDSRKFCEESHVVIEDKAGLPSGIGTRMVFVYRLEDVVGPPRSVPSFEQLRGRLRDALKPLRGGEAPLRRKRRNSYRSGRENQK